MPGGSVAGVQRQPMDCSGVIASHVDVEPPSWRDSSGLSGSIRGEKARGEAEGLREKGPE